MLATLEAPQRHSVYPILDISPFLVTDDDFYDFCQKNREMKFERNPDGTIIIMSLTGGKTGKRNSKLNLRIGLWAESNTGNVFNSSTGFKLPNGAIRSPDLAWVSDSLWDSLTDREQEKFPPVSPEFVVEIKSFTDKTAELHEKMQEYIDNGVKLAWLINPYEKEVRVYRADGTIERIQGFDKKISGEDVLLGFEFDLDLL